MKKTSQSNKITRISEQYFGPDKTRNYIKHDFRRALEGFVQREVLLHIMVESSRMRHSTEETLDYGGNIVSLSRGDFDPDNAGFLYSIFKNHELGSMLDLRLLLNKNETGTGGSFIKDLTELSLGDFIEYYIYKESESIAIPPILSRSYMESRKNEDGLNGYEFIMRHKEEVNDAVKLLVLKAKKYNDSNYKDRIVTNYEALKFHKDKQPTKYEVNEVAETMGLMTFSEVTRKDLSKVETKLIAKSLNEFAELVESYRLLAGGIEGLVGSSWPLETYVKRTFQVFNKKVPMEVQEKVIANLETYLAVSFNLSFWSIR